MRFVSVFVLDSEWIVYLFWICLNLWCCSIGLVWLVVFKVVLFIDYGEEFLLFMKVKKED